MAGLALKGELKKKGDIEQINDTFTKREIWLEIDQDTDWPQEVMIEFIKDKCSIVEKYSEGDILEVDVNIRGNRGKLKDGTERVFNQLNGWRVSGNASGGTQQATAPPPDDGGGDSDTDDLPF